MPNQQIEPLVTLLAIKAILLAPGFTHSERRLLGALIEHFSRETGRCDPSLERLAELLGMTVRTVERALAGLVRKRVLRFFRHGGRCNRNRYEIAWERLAEIEVQWRSRFNAAAEARATKLSQPTRHSRRADGDRNVDQTYSTNLLNRTYSQHGRKQRYRASIPSSADVSQTKAHQKLDAELRNRLSVDVYAKTITSIEDDTWLGFVKAEVQRGGAGLLLLTQHLQRLGLWHSAEATGLSSPLEIAGESTLAESPFRLPETTGDSG